MWVSDKYCLVVCCLSQRQQIVLSDRLTSSCLLREGWEKSPRTFSVLCSVPNNKPGLRAVRGRGMFLRRASKPMLTVKLCKWGLRIVHTSSVSQKSADSICTCLLITA